MSDWRSIETAPKDVLVLAFDGDHLDCRILRYARFFNLRHHHYDWYDRSWNRYRPTHWQPLPDPPKETTP